MFYAIISEKKHLPCIEKLVTGDELTEKEILQVYAHHLFEPLLPNAELLVDKYIGIDASKCPFCTERKEAVKSGITSFGENSYKFNRSKKEGFKLALNKILFCMASIVHLSVVRSHLLLTI